MSKSNPKGRQVGMNKKSRAVPRCPFCKKQQPEWDEMRIGAGAGFVKTITYCLHCGAIWGAERVPVVKKQGLITQV